MVAESALALFKNMLRQLKQVADDLKLLDEAGWPHAENGVNAGGDAGLEEAKAAARSVVVKATEVARDALRLCSRFDEPANPPQSRQRKRPPKKQDN